VRKKEAYHVADETDDNSGSKQINSRSPEFRTELAKQLEDLVPEAVADGKVDTSKLKELLAEDAGDTNERFGLFWPGKKRAMRAAQEPTTATLKPAPELSKDWDDTGNIFIEGDNLEVLKVLQKQYHNSIKMIYIDPPYNTGKDFVYPDNFKEGLQNYLEFSKQVDEGNKKISTNVDTAGRYHSNWLNMMYPRLKLARNLLTDDGVIFISIGSDESDNLQKVCNEIFGEGNYLDTFIVRSNPRGNQAKKHTASQHEYVLSYARNLQKVQPLGHSRTDEEYNKNDNSGYYREIGLRKRGAGSRRIDAPNQFYPIYWSTESNRISIQKESIGDVEVLPMLSDGTEGRWRWASTTVAENSDKLIARLVTGRDGTKRYDVFEKDYFSEDKNVKIKSLLVDKEYNYENATDDIRGLFNGLKVFPYTKPRHLISHLLQSLKLSDEDIVLDFFAGSSTTAHSIIENNADITTNIRFIMVQLPEPIDEDDIENNDAVSFCKSMDLAKTIADISRERINRAGEKIKTDFAEKLAERETPLDIGYRTFKLSDTNFTKWQSTATSDLGELQSRLDLMRESSDDNATEADLLVEVMLKLGLPLTTRTETRDVAGLHVHQAVADAQSNEDAEANDSQPVFYLNEHTKPTLEQLRAVVTELTPSRFVILDDAFQGDNQLKTNLVQTCKSYDVELWTV
jgi:adenine-specific DNA-methyltransferase